MWGDIAIAFLLAFITSFVMVPYTIKLAKKVGAIDYPSDRRVNKRPVPRIGGLAVIAGFLVSAIYLIITMTIEGNLDLNRQENYKMKLLGFLLGIIVLGIFAYADDVKTLKPWQKLIGQVLAALIVYFFGIRIDTINEIVIHPVLNFILTIGWIVGITNAINLIDGLDGLSSGVSLISCISLLIIFSTNDSPLISIILITALAGAIGGFLPFNLNPAKTFIGDVGAQFLGFSLATISILGVAKTVTLVVLIAPILVLALPIFDTLFAIIRRIVKGKSLKAVFQADKGHLHHRLMKRGFSQKQAVAILYGASASLGMFAVILIDDGIWKALSFALIVIAIIAIGYKELVNFKNEEIKSLKQNYKEKKNAINKNKEENNESNKENIKNKANTKKQNRQK